MNSLKDNKNKTLTSDIVDLSFLNEHLLSDLEQLSQMIMLFLEQTPDKIKLLENSVKNKDFTSIKANSHFLKSSFTIMGLQCKDLLSEIEILSSQSKEIEKITKLSKIVLCNFNESTIEYKKILFNIHQKIKQE